MTVIRSLTSTFRRIGLGHKLGLAKESMTSCSAEPREGGPVERCELVDHDQRGRRDSGAGLLGAHGIHEGRHSVATGSEGEHHRRGRRRAGDGGSTERRHQQPHMGWRLGLAAGARAGRERRGGAVH